MPMKTTNFKVAKVSNRGVLSRTGTSTAVTVFGRHHKAESEAPQSFMLIAIPTSLVIALQSGRSGMIENGSSICGAVRESCQLSSRIRGPSDRAPTCFTDSMHMAGNIALSLDPRGGHKQGTTCWMGPPLSLS